MSSGREKVPQFMVRYVAPVFLAAVLLTSLGYFFINSASPYGENRTYSRSFDSMLELRRRLIDGTTDKNLYADMMREDLDAESFRLVTQKFLSSIDEAISEIDDDGESPPTDYEFRKWASIDYRGHHFYVNKNPEMWAALLNGRFGDLDRFDRKSRTMLFMAGGKSNPMADGDTGYLSVEFDGMYHQFSTDEIPDFVHDDLLYWYVLPESIQEVKQELPQPWSRDLTSLEADIPDASRDSQGQDE